MPTLSCRGQHCKRWMPQEWAGMRALGGLMECYRIVVESEISKPGYGGLELGCIMQAFPGSNGLSAGTRTAIVTFSKFLVNNCACCWKKITKVYNLIVQNFILINYNLIAYSLYSFLTLGYQQISAEKDLRLS